MSLHNNLETTIGFVSDLPNEISQIIFSDLPPKTLLNCRRVSRSWKLIAENDNIWKSKFQDQKYWKYYNDDSETDSWYELYKERYILEKNWINDRFIQHKLSGHSDETHCVKFFKNWILTGSDDCTIRIWDNETFECLRVLGRPNPEIIRENLSAVETNEFHMSEVRCMDINDKYLVSGTSDGCLIWKMPDLKPIKRLVTSTQDSFTFINGVTLYNDYIICHCFEYIEIWKSSLDVLENRLEFNIQHRLKGDGFISDFCNHSIIYCRKFRGIGSWNIETGQMIQEFQYNQAVCLTVSDRYLFVNQCDKLIVDDLQTNKTIKILSNEGAVSLFIINNQIISINDESTIKIWNLNDLKLFKEFKNLKYEELNLWPICSICCDSKKLAAFTIDGDVVIYDFTEKLRKKYLKYL